MGSAIRERENVMHFRCRSNSALAPTHLAQGMRRDIPAPDGWPHAVVPLLHFWRPLISVVPGGDQPFVIRAVRFVGEIRTAGIPAGFLWFPWHCRLHSKRAAGVSARGPHPDFSMIHYMPDPMRSASGIDAVSLLGIIFNGFCFINLIPHFFDYLMCPYYPALYDGLLSNCYRW